jgi:acyl-CoA thioester hydrolase
MPLKNPPVVIRLSVRYGDLDPYGHVNNAVHLMFFEEIRFTDLEAGDIPGARYVIAGTTTRYKAPIFLDDTLHGAAKIRAIGNRSYAMDFELRKGDSFEDGALVCEGSVAHVFFDPASAEVQPRPDWFLPTVADLEGRSEESFAPEDN